jgi:hypothetical protein
MVGGTRFELVTSSMSTRRSTTELTAHIGHSKSVILNPHNKASINILKTVYFVHGTLSKYLLI